MGSVLYSTAASEGEGGYIVIVIVALHSMLCAM